MELVEILEIKQKINIKPQKENEYYVSAIQDIKDNRIVIDMPYMARRALLMKPGTEVEVIFVNGEGVYQFFSRVLTLSTNNNISFYEIDMPKEWKYAQRRQFFRLDIVLNVEFVLRDPRSAVPLAEPKVIHGKTINISGDGVKVITAEPLGRDNKITLNLNILEVGTFTIPVSVIWTDKKIVDNNPVFYTALKFNYISSKDQASIIKYIFQKQAMWRKNL